MCFDTESVIELLNLSNPNETPTYSYLSGILLKIIFTSSSSQYHYKIYIINLGFISTNFESCDDRQFLAEFNPNYCKCSALFSTQLWSMKKMTWAKKAPEFPPNISMLSGCAVPINRNKVLFIGGHYTQHQFSNQQWNSDVST